MPTDRNPDYKVPFLCVYRDLIPENTCNTYVELSKSFPLPCVSVCDFLFLPFWVRLLHRKNIALWQIVSAANLHYICPKLTGCKTASARSEQNSELPTALCVKLVYITLNNTMECWNAGLFVWDLWLFFLKGKYSSEFLISSSSGYSGLQITTLYFSLF